MKNHFGTFPQIEEYYMYGDPKDVDFEGYYNDVEAWERDAKEELRQLIKFYKKEKMISEAFTVKMILGDPE